MDKAEWDRAHNAQNLAGCRAVGVLTGLLADPTVYKLSDDTVSRMQEILDAWNAAHARCEDAMNRSAP